jgi:D-beta-D-heptose 7-phosphate kinase/D-beta-D-heptose 1-phosphate adenosyltransferase
MRDPQSKILTLDAALQVREAHRAAGRTVAFTNGCYDLFHAGHARSIAFARAQADVLFLAVNTDRSVKENKGDLRPVIDEANRLSVLAALECVDHVILFDSREVLPLVEQLRPDVLVKGADRQGEVVGQSWVESYGGRVALCPVVPGISTTRIIERVLAVYGGR